MGNTAIFRFLPLANEMAGEFLSRPTEHSPPAAILFARVTPIHGTVRTNSGWISVNKE
jgi:hypothetical protein